MAITTDQVKELRDKTGVSIMQCKKALEDAQGDQKKALLALRKLAGAAAGKKSERSLGAGAVQAYVHNNNEVGAIVVLSCETDFVAKNEEFVSLAREIAMHITATAPRYMRRDEVSAEEEGALREMFAKEVKEKPKGVQEKVIAGKLDAYFKEAALFEQPYIKDPDRTVQILLEEAVQKFGERVELVRFARYAVK